MNEILKYVECLKQPAKHPLIRITWGFWWFGFFKTHSSTSHSSVMFMSNPWQPNILRLWFLVCCCTSYSKTFHSYWDIFIACESLQNVSLSSAPTVSAQGRIFIVLSHGTSVYTVSPIGLPRWLTAYDKLGILRTILTQINSILIFLALCLFLIVIYSNNHSF